MVACTEFSETILEGSTASEFHTYLRKDMICVGLSIHSLHTVVMSNLMMLAMAGTSLSVDQDSICEAAHAEALCMRRTAAGAKEASPVCMAPK